MEHDEAIQSGAAVRYAAHELSPAEQDAFEGHFFDCRECADEVRFELAFAANVRAVAREQRAELQPAPQPRSTGSSRRWRQWLRLHPVPASSFAVNLALAGGLGYVLLTGAHQRSLPRFTQPYFAPGPTHGAEDVHAIPAGETSYLVRFPAPSAASGTYAYEILNAAGRREWSGSLPAPAGAEEFLYLRVPLDGLPAGVHTLVVRGESGGEIASWSKFRISR